MSTQQQFLRNVVATYGTQLVLLPLSLTGTAMQARLVGPTGRGQVSLLLATVGISSLVLGLGLNSSIGFHLAAKKTSIAALKRSLPAFWLGIFAAFSALLVAFFLAGGERRLIGTLPTRGGTTALIVLFTLSLAGGWITAILTSHRQFGAVNRAALAAGVLQPAAYGTMLAFQVRAAGGIPMEAVLTTMVFVEVTRTVLLFVAVSRIREEAPVQSTPLMGMLRYSLFAYACDVVQFLTYRADVWIIQATRGDEELGRYGLAVSLAELALLAAASFATVLFPYVPTLSPAEAAKTTARVGVLTLGTTAVIAVLGLGLAVPLVPLLFSSAFEASVPLLGVLLIGVVPMSLSKIMGNYFAATGQLGVSLTAALAGMVTCLTGDLLLIPRYGALAAAGCTSVAYWVFTLVMLGFFFRRSPLSPQELLTAVREGRGRHA
jgi:O-antigen/teichoic acid export membrane protein